MLSFHTAAAIAAAPTTASLDRVVKQLLADRVRDWTANGLLDLTHLLIVQARDTENDILEEIGFSPLVNPIEVARFPSLHFIPHHDWLERHDRWFELIFTFQDGFAFVLFVQDSKFTDPDLLAFCHTHAAAGGQ